MLRTALLAEPGLARDSSLTRALATQGIPLEDEPEADWADAVRDRVESLRQEARLELARDRWRGLGRAHPEEVLQAWQACFESDTACEEAASALMRTYLAQRRRPQAVAVYERCSDALFGLGLKMSCELEDLRAATDGAASLQDNTAWVAGGRPATRRGEERRLVTVAVVEVSPSASARMPIPRICEVVGVGLARTISEAEAFGGSVMSISGPVMTLLFGVPQTYEDDPERALRAAVRVVASVSGTHGKGGHGVPDTEATPLRM